MAYKTRVLPPGIPAHIVNRGVNRQPIFSDDQDKAQFTSYLALYSQTMMVSVHAWVLMDNHFHILASSEAEGGISRFMQRTTQRYVRYYNRRRNRVGALFERRFRSHLVTTERYFLACSRYIELNPVRAGLVNSPEEFYWTSFHASSGTKPSSIFTPHSVYQSLGADEEERQSNYAALVLAGISSEQERDITTALERERDL